MQMTQLMVLRQLQQQMGLRLLMTQQLQQCLKLQLLMDSGAHSIQQQLQWCSQHLRD
jgi:hypothetical protein